MTSRRERGFFKTPGYLKRFQIHNVINNLPVLAVAFRGWQYAARSFSTEHRNYRAKQQWKSFFLAFINPQFASTWFAILGSTEYNVIALHRHDLYFKPFRVYMSVRWTKKQKMKVLLDTYRFVTSKGQFFKQEILHKSQIEIANLKLSANLEAGLTLGYDYRYRKEGEMVISFNCEQLGGMIAATAFSFEEMGSGIWACRIACIQGHKHTMENPTKAAQKFLHGLRPKSFVIFAIQELARRLGCVAVFGAGDAIQAYRGKHALHLPWRHRISFDYDAIWRDSGGTLGNDGWYQIPLVPLKRKPHEIKTNKRALYARRYKLLEGISLQIEKKISEIAR